MNDRIRLILTRGIERKTREGGKGESGHRKARERETGTIKLIG